MLLCSRATSNSCFQTERVYGSAFSDHTDHFWILVPMQNCIVLVSSVNTRNPDDSGKEKQFKEK